MKKAPKIRGLEHIGTLQEEFYSPAEVTLPEEQKEPRCPRALLDNGSKDLNFSVVVTNWTRKQWARLMFVFSRKPKIDRPLGSSDSDARKYVTVVMLAFQDNRMFSNFRSHPGYVAILDHVSWGLGNDYLKVLQRRKAFEPSQMESYRQFSTIGGPATYSYGEYGFVAPTFFRYVKVCSDLEILFPGLERFHVAEIGIGWGGQTWITASRGGGAQFSLFDLPEVNLLASKALDKVLSRDVALTFENALSLKTSYNCDLVVSNYAFSEIPRAAQEGFVEQLLLGCPRGYITWNSGEENRFSLDELLDMFPGSQVLPENPRTGEANAIFVWGHDPIGAKALLDEAAG